MSGLSVCSEVVYNQTLWIFRTTSMLNTGFRDFEPVSLKKHVAEALLFLANYFDQETMIEKFWYLAGDQKVSIAMDQLNGIIFQPILKS